MIAVSVKADVDRARWEFAHLGEGVSKAAAQAINRVANTVRSRAVKEIARQTGSTQATIREAVVVSGTASRIALYATVSANRRPMNLIEWVEKSKRVYGAFHHKLGVIAKAWGQSKTYKGTFIGFGKRSEKNIVFARVGEARDKLRHIRGPSIPKEFSRDLVRDLMRSTVRERFPVEFLAALKNIERRSR